MPTDGVDYQGEMGIPRPEGQPALGIGEVDGPYHLALRHALAPFLSPGAVDKMRPFMEQSGALGSSISGPKTARWTWSSTTPARFRPSSP